MTKRRKAANPTLARPPTKEEFTMIAKEPAYLSTVIVCFKCKRPGGTLIKVDDQHIHQNTALCKTLKG